MPAVSQIAGRLRQGVADWQQIRLVNLLFNHQQETVMTLIGLIGLALLVVMARTGCRSPGRSQVGLPALLRWSSASPFAFIRHTPVVLALAGLPFFMIALADPHPTP